MEKAGKPIIPQLFWLTQLLGTGNFGKVMQATASGNNGETVTVAVKMLKENHTDQVQFIPIKILTRFNFMLTNLNKNYP